MSNTSSFTTTRRRDRRSLRPGDEVVVHYDPVDAANAYLRNDGLPGTWLFGLGYAGFAAVSAVGLIVTGVRRWKQRQLMVDTSTANVQSVSIGPAELKGTALLDGRTPMPAPFTDDECLVASYQIEEYDDDEGGSWKTIEADTQFIPFELDDGTGRIRVEPTSDATFDLEPGDWDTTYVDSDTQGPEPVQRFVRGRDGLGFPSNASGKENDRNYRQNLIRPEESVYVYGAAQPRDDAETVSGNASRLVVTSADDTAVEDTMFMISDDSEEDLTDRRALALWRAPVGGLFLLVALAFTLGILGPEIGLTPPDII